MLNISPLKKSKTNVKIPTIIICTPSRDKDIEEFLMHENLIETASKSNYREEKIFKEVEVVQVA
jgi:hypothetical protein